MLGTPLLFASSASAHTATDHCPGDDFMTIDGVLTELAEFEDCRHRYPVRIRLLLL